MRQSSEAPIVRSLDWGLKGRGELPYLGGMAAPLYIAGIGAEPGVGDVALVARVLREVVGGLIADGDELLVALALARLGRWQVPSGGAPLADLIDAIAQVTEQHHGGPTAHQVRELLASRLRPVLAEPATEPASGSGFRRKPIARTTATPPEQRATVPLERFERATARPPSRVVAIRRRDR
jgi:hypothetical protein